MYLINNIDWYSHKVIDYKLSSVLTKPEIMISDQGSNLVCSSGASRPALNSFLSTKKGEEHTHIPCIVRLLNLSAFGCMSRGLFSVGKIHSAERINDLAGYVHMGLQARIKQFCY